MPVRGESEEGPCGGWTGVAAGTEGAAEQKVRLYPRRSAGAAFVRSFRHVGAPWESLPVALCAMQGICDAQPSGVM